MQNALNFNAGGGGGGKKQKDASSAETHAGVATGTDGDAPTAASAAGFFVGQVLSVATAPASYLFGMLGGMPGWFSDAVFEVSVVRTPAVGEGWGQGRDDCGRPSVCCLCLFIFGHSFFFLSYPILAYRILT